jgi:high-affinity nickel-transport protein
MKRAEASGQVYEISDVTKIQGGGCLVRIVAPLLRAVDKPWKMYPIGVLFGFGKILWQSSVVHETDDDRL